MSYGSWTLDHPWKALGIIVLLCALGGACGVALASAMDASHLISPDNIGAGAAFGAGGALVGLTAAVRAIRRIEMRRR